MNAKLERHPTAENLAAFLQGRLPPGLQALLEQHIAECSVCCDLLARLPHDTLLEGVAARDTDLGRFALRESATQIPAELAEHPRYRIVKRLGAGGMGVVFQAEHRLMERTVALKVINPELLKNKAAVERFRREAKAAGLLTHPNIVTAHDADQAGELHFLVMEYVDGISLAELVERKGAAPVHQACHFIRQAALGLQHAHERGMVHRDLKPQNLMVTRKGQVKILDFGLARLARNPEPASADGNNDAAGDCTKSGVVMGTPDYMAPEQTRSAHDVDIRADIYSLGCTLYFLLRVAKFRSLREVERKMLAQVEETPVSLLEARSAPPREVVAVVEKMMAKEPAARYQTPLEAARALAPFADAKGKTRRSAAAGRTRSRKWLLLAVGVAAASLIIGMIVRGLGSLGGGEPEKRVAAPPINIEKKLPVLFVLAEQYHDGDFRPVRDLLQKEGFASVVAVPAKSCRAIDGRDTSVEADIILTEKPPAATDYAALVLPGGYIFKFKDDWPERKIVRQMVADMSRANKPVAAINSGMLVLLMAGALDNKKAATPLFVEKLAPLDRDVRWINQPVVRDGWLLTGDAPKVAQELVGLLKQ